MLDTNLFNALADGEIQLPSFAGRLLFATHLQCDELDKTANEARRAKLREAFRKIEPDELITSGAMWDVSRWDQATWSQDDDLLERMRALLRELDKKDRKKRKDEDYNQACDVLSAATAIKNGLTFVTDDENLRMVVHRFGARAIDAMDFASGAAKAT